MRNKELEMKNNRIGVGSLVIIGSVNQNHVTFSFLILHFLFLIFSGVTR